MGIVKLWFLWIYPTTKNYRPKNLIHNLNQEITPKLDYYILLLVLLPELVNYLSDLLALWNQNANALLLVFWVVTGEMQLVPCWLLTWSHAYRNLSLFLTLHTVSGLRKLHTEIHVLVSSSMAFTLFSVPYFIKKLLYTDDYSLPLLLHQDTATFKV